ncbi:LTA synthase family protein [Clostridium sp. Marseille-P3244]|uniref:LTA synthase family protein n=1 Tax=Clostridium sp. Marseille-P3244 TaxID=1871020 RepID=UPI001356616E|nr:LTA synthase family protein [Clostridium sp. Marseille-P3244]
MSYFLLDFILRRTNISYSLLNLYDKIPLFFVLGWCFLLCGIICILPGMIKKIFMGITAGIYSILTIVHGAYINVFDKFFSFSDLSLAGEGIEFLDISYIHIRKIIVACVIISLLLMALGIWLVPGREKNTEKKRRIPKILAGLLIMATGLAGIFYSEHQFSDDNDAMAWDAATNVSLIYEEFIDTPKCLLMSGLYQYTFRDFCKSFNLTEHIEQEEVWKELDEYFANLEYEHNSNEKTGIFQEKYLILIQLENIDQWMLTEENMPNLYALREESIDFVNHYSPAFATGKTFNTEFIVNTGWIPRSTGDSTYIYTKNSYPYSLANLFRNAGYSANSFHGASGTIYNRETAHAIFGYEAYYSYIEMDMDDYTMDSQMTNGFDLMIEEEPFFDFIITYSGHGPFSEETSAAQAHLDEVREYAEITDATYLAGLAQAKETDVFVGNRIQKLEDSGLLADTVLIFYSDHYSYSTIDEELLYELKGTSDSNLLQNTPFFIWSQDAEAEKITKVTNTADILPTLANLFGLDLDYKYCFGYDAFDPEYTGWVVFSDLSWYDGTIYWKPAENEEESDYVKEMSAMINQKINISWDVLDTDYFSYLYD